MTVRAWSPRVRVEVGEGGDSLRVEGGGAEWRDAIEEGDGAGGKCRPFEAEGGGEGDAGEESGLGIERRGEGGGAGGEG